MSETPAFKDHFSDASRGYAAARPSYPGALFDYLRELAPRAEVVWDCATGSGQAAVGLAARFARVIATDASAAQLEHAERRENISYRAATAEESGLGDSSVGLVTVAQALHWFSFGVFFDEAERVLEPGGVIAAWCYGLHAVGAEIDAVIGRYYQETVGAWWPAERRHIESAYATIPCSFDAIETPAFEMRREWTLDEVIAYVRTWSATKRCARETGGDPAGALREELAAVWGTGTRGVVWPVTLRAWRV